jgi:hypothetical protein
MVMPLVNPLYFKVYPRGSTESYDYDTGGVVDRDHETEGLEFEKYAYNELFKLTKYNVTPNILCKAATSNVIGFKDFISAISLDRRVKFMKHIREYNQSVDIEPDNTIWEETGVIITQPGGAKFYEKIRGLTPIERKQVMFQLIYTLYVFEKIQFSHGDLHTGNIFIVDIPETEMIYIVEEVQFRFKTTKLVKIYDFDHGTICKTTSIKINTDEEFIITKKLNPIRNYDADFNNRLAETNIFNKNLDIVILLNALKHDCTDIYDSFNCLDQNFDKFLRDIFPGFDSKNALSQEKIGDTYTRLISGSPQIRYEPNRIFDIDIADHTEINNYGVNKKIMNMKWINYLKKISTNYGRIVKDLEDIAENNHLWIPDEIIIPKDQMFSKEYFTELQSKLPIDVRYQIVYTIDERL